MRSYELSYILKPDLEEEILAETTEKFSNLITSSGGEIIAVDNWGKRKLAFEIEKFKEGVYIFVRFRADNPTLKELDRTLKISDVVLRNMIVSLN